MDGWSNRWIDLAGASAGLGDVAAGDLGTVAWLFNVGFYEFAVNQDPEGEDQLYEWQRTTLIFRHTTGLLCGQLVALVAAPRWSAGTGGRWCWRSPRCSAPPWPLPVLRGDWGEQASMALLMGAAGYALLLNVLAVLVGANRDATLASSPQSAPDRQSDSK